MAASITGTVDAGSLTYREHSTAAADRLTRDQTRHIFKPTCNFDLPIGSTPAARIEVLHVAEAAGNVLAFGAGLYESGSSTSITFDLLKNGSSVLSSVVTVVHGSGDRTTVAGSINTVAYVAGDVFTVALATSSTTGAQGPYCQATFDEVVTA
jgi:hypothetical protein